MAWPFSGTWAPLTDGVVEVRGIPVGLSVVDCGELSVPSGQLLCCDPFAEIESDAEDPVVRVPAGRHRVQLTLADVSGRLDGSQVVEAYLTITVKNGKEVTHRPFVPDGEESEEPGQEEQEEEEEGELEFIGVEVASDTVAMVDAEAFESGMPEDADDWEAEVFDGGDEPWYEALEDPDQIREGTANVGLPRAGKGENAVLCHAGFGEGRYPVMGGFDKGGRLVAVHIDFQVVGTFD